jgi:2-polyprenyl-3-methyl-5-hydroxy-6-metoxy-1,4-benzoquinol methylase
MFPDCLMNKKNALFFLSNLFMDKFQHMPITRILGDKDLAFDSIHQDCNSFISNYDTNRRIEVLLCDFLDSFDWPSKKVLEVGTGLGAFTGVIRGFNPKKFSTVDIAPNLIKKIKDAYPGIDARTADLMNLSQQFLQKYDLIICSEVIEHTPNPHEAFVQLSACLAPNGILVLSTPNRRWYWLLLLAKAFGLRNKYKGYENWSSPSELIGWCNENSLRVLKKEGVHLIPWQLILKSWLRAIDIKVRNSSFGLSINLAIKAQRLK